MTTRYELAQRLVEREVIYCVSQLINDLYKATIEYQIGDLSYDTIQSICSKDDWEESGRSFIMEDADFDQLEEVADMFGYWSDVLSECGLPDGVEDVAEYVEAHPVAGPKIREAVEKLVDDWEEVGLAFDLDPDHVEAYEHWIVTGWLGRKLEEKGEMVCDDILGMVVWGRKTTGQSIALDYVMEQIAVELWGDELTEDQP